MNTEREVTSELPFCDGKLVKWTILVPLRAYDADDPGDQHGITFVRENVEVQVQSTGTLRELASQLGYKLEGQVAKDPVGFAGIYGELLNLGRVTSDCWLYEFIEPMFGIRLAEHVPRIVNHALRFLIASFSLDRAPFLVDITVDLRTGSVSQTVIEKPKNTPRSLDPVDVQAMYRWPVGASKT